jgi:hypothetical protein
MKNNTNQASRQNPTRIQTQWISVILLIVVLSVLAVILNLNITTKSAHAGVQVRILEAEREKLERTITGSRTLLAQMTSSKTMQERAKALGYQAATIDNLKYVYVAEYVGKEGKAVVIPKSRNNPTQNIIKPIYTRSMWDWLFQGTFTLLDRDGG